MFNNCTHRNGLLGNIIEHCHDSFTIYCYIFITKIYSISETTFSLTYVLKINQFCA